MKAVATWRGVKARARRFSRSWAAKSASGFPGASGWNSDYNGAAASSASYKVNGKASKFKLIAYYPEPAPEA
jgi:hypothetical protein